MMQGPPRPHRHEPRRLPQDLLNYPGKWVAIKNDQVVEVRETPDAVVEALHSRDIKNATVMRVPSEHDKETKSWWVSARGLAPCPGLSTPG